jgi:hypothetical protein
MKLMKYALLFMGAGIAWGLLGARASETAATAPAGPPAVSCATASAPAMTGLLPMGNPALPKKIYTEVLLRDQAESVKGDLSGYDETVLTIRTGKGLQTLQWRDLTGASAFTLRARLIDKTQPRHWLALGAFGWGMGTREQARTAFDHAVGLDSSLRGEVESILRSEAGAYLHAAAGAGPTYSAGPAETQAGNAGGGRKAGGREPLPGELFPEVRGK